MISPFLVGFDFPDSAGTYVNASAGAGNYRFTPACSRFTYGSGLQEGGLTVQHRIATSAPKTELVRSRLVPAYLTFSAGGDLIHRSTTVLAFDSMPEQDGGPPATPLESDPDVGDHWDRMGWAGRARIGFDWRMIGVEFGAILMDYDHGKEIGDSSIAEETVVLPVVGLRVGDPEAIYFTAEFLQSNPMITGGGYGGYGIGVKIASTRISLGVSAGPYQGGALRLKVAQNQGPFLITVAALANPTELNVEGDYGLSLGVGYKLPGRP